ncbi:DUF998 domain-containing [Lecanosticta acicola]|uniref:DUF998 domain-containing n=1 Tax=Lecanosticta acicola TaxID=111012 RepID=A0AAI8YVP3_9PEZI|nr:DUF998 domain-containing [Lecanosticta acicola]
MPPKPGPAAPLPHRPPLLPAVLFAIASGSWFFWELRAQAAFDAGTTSYDWKIESLSDLGVDYRQVHPLKHYNVTSHRHGSQNFNFLQAGVCFGLAQLILLFATTKNRATQNNALLLRNLRLLLTALYAGSMLLIARIHGGPREKFWKIIGWHWMGFGTAAVAGNLNSLLAAAVPTVGVTFEAHAVYRAFSAVLGMAGLYSLWRFQNLGEWHYQTELGLWQRGMVYPVLAWEAMTAVALVAANVSGGGGGGGGGAGKAKRT